MALGNVIEQAERLFKMPAKTAMPAMLGCERIG